MRKVLSPQLIKQIKELKASNLSTRLIANTLSIAKGTVFNALRSSSEGVSAQVNGGVNSKVPTLGQYPRLSKNKGRTFRDMFCDYCRLGAYCRLGYDLTLRDICCEYDEGEYEYLREE